MLCAKYRKVFLRSLISIFLLSCGERCWSEKIILNFSSTEEELLNKGLLVGGVLVLSGNGTMSQNGSEFSPTITQETTVNYDIDLREVTDFGNFIASDYAFNMNGTIYLPTSSTIVDTGSLNINSQYGKVIHPTDIEIGEDNLILIKKTTAQTSGLTYNGTEIENDGHSSKPSISNIAYLEKDSVDIDKAILDITDVDIDPTIDRDTEVKFTILTTPSVGVTIMNDLTISAPIHIRLKL